MDTKPPAVDEEGLPRAGGAPPAAERSEQLQARALELVMTQCIIAGVGALAAVALMALPGFALWTRVAGVPIIVAVMLAVLATNARRSVRRVAASYRTTIQGLEQQINDVMFQQNLARLTDQVSGVYTLEYFITRLRQECDRARRYGRVVSVLLVDIAGFRALNEKYGRSTGNQLLRRFGVNILRNALRSTDIVGRYGGDQFAVLLPETDHDRAINVIHRLAGRAERGVQVSDGFQIPLPAVFGLASFPDQASSEDELLRSAEAALKAAKRAQAVRPSE